MRERNPMPRRRHSHPTETAVATPAATVIVEDPMILRKDLTRLAVVFVFLLALLAGAAYWQRVSPIPNQLGERLSNFVNF